MPPRTENRLSEDERRNRSQDLFELIQQQQFNCAFPPETLLDLDEVNEAEVWTPHPIIHRPLFELLRFGRHIDEYKHSRVYKNILPRLVGVCENQLLYWHLSGAVTEANNPIDRILITENSGQFWFDYIPIAADQIRSDLLDDTHQENSKLLYCYFLCFLCLIQLKLKKYQKYCLFLLASYPTLSNIKQIS